MMSSRILRICTFILLSLPFTTVADTTGNVRETISIDEFAKRGGKLTKVPFDNFDLIKVVVNLDGIDECTVANPGFNIYESDAHNNILASFSIEKLNGTYEFFAKESYLKNIGLSIGCDDDGFFGYLEVPLKGL